ncbi:MAG TPA: hypothetical protein VFA49_00500, partial [Chloroflexota bacterium]|nr:hypothetical protein [Chloroflexota bacterium]
MGQVQRDKTDFARHVRSALARLYDPIALQAHPLARATAGYSPHPGRGSQLGEVLRQRLLEAIEALKPDPRVDRGSKAWSPYRLLHLRYVEAHDPVAVQHQLAMSKSQYYREHEQALERLASLLWEQTSPGTQAALSIPRQDGAERAHHNLPLQLTSFVGRKSELAQVAHLLRASRLLTLTGAGGSGKTRLALQAADALLGGYQQGVWVVELAPLAESGLVPQTAAFAMGVREEPGEPIEATLVRTLARQQRLLVLDNCEHLIAACARLAEALLKACPNLAILVTSREPLHITGETVFQVPPLSTPDPRRLPQVHRLRQYEAIQLFVDRAAAVHPGFELTPGNGEAVAHICDRLDGIPLAIELAAARVQALSVQQINDRLQDRFRLLTSGSRTALPRHQTLRAMVDWSFALLPEPQRALLRRLSVFAGGWTLEAAEAVCSAEPVARQDVLNLLGELVAKSLVTAEESSAGAVRYRMLETFRQYGLQRLEEAGELTGTYDAHARYFVEIGNAGDAELVGPTQLACRRRLDLEHDNFRAVLSRSREGLIAERSGAPLGPSLAKNLYLFWFKSSYLGEGADWLTGMATVAESH